MTHKYKLKYKIDFFNRPEGYSQKDMDFNENADALTDALILGSILYAPDGGVSHQFVSVDSKLEPLNAHDFFMAWASLAYSLPGYEGMSMQHKQILNDTHQAVRDLVLSNRNMSEEDKLKEAEMREMDTNPRMIKGKYILDDHGEIIPATSLSQWGEWFSNPIERFGRIVSQTMITPEIYVSTVFLGMDHGFPELQEMRGQPIEDYKPILWETMVFGSELEDDCERYTSREDAIKGHLAMMDAVRATLK